MGNNKDAALMGDMTNDKMGTANVPVDGKPPLDKPTKSAPSAAYAKYAESKNKSKITKRSSASIRFDAVVFDHL